jgi:glutamate carboxypeptidase
MSPLPLLLALAAPALCAVPAETPLSREESRIVREVEAREAASRALLARIVEINSGTMNFEGVRQVGSILRAELDGLGFETSWVDGTPFHRAGHLVGQRAARTGKRRGPAPSLLLIGHLDTVFEKESPFQRFEPLPGDRARGPGVIDMKGGDVVLLRALQALFATGDLDALSVTVVMTGDEEKAGAPLSLSRMALREAADRSDYALGFEDGSGRSEKAVIARRGSSDWTLSTTGTPAHSSQIFRGDVGPGAIFEAARILNEFRKQLSGEKYLTFSPGVIVGGTTAELDAAQARGEAFGKSNVVAGVARAQGDLRTVSPEQLESAKARMRAIVAEHLPMTSAEIVFDDGYPPMAPTEGNTALLALYDRASRDLGLGPVTASDPGAAGAADVAFAALRVRRKMAIDGIGLMGSDDHTEKETAELSTLSSQSKRAALLMYRLSKIPDTR